MQRTSQSLYSHSFYQPNSVYYTHIRYQTIAVTSDYSVRIYGLIILFVVNVPCASVPNVHFSAMRITFSI